VRVQWRGRRAADDSVRELQQVATHGMLWSAWLEYSARLCLRVLYWADSDRSGWQGQGASRGMGRESVDEQDDVPTVTDTPRRPAPHPFDCAHFRLILFYTAFFRSLASQYAVTTVLSQHYHYAILNRNYTTTVPQNITSQHLAKHTRNTHTA
jgi:hypothetical protein